MFNHLQSTRRRAWAAVAAALCVAVFMVPRSNGQTVISSASISSLRTALASGGTIQLQFVGTITATTPLVVTADAVLDGTGFAPVISGGNVSQIFNVATNVHFTVINLTLTQGNAIGTTGTLGATGSAGSTKGGTGGNGGNGGNGLGGVLLNRGFTLMEDCILSNNLATGAVGGTGGTGGNASNGTGGTGGNGGNGGTGLGGAIYNLNTLTLSNCTIANNSATGGDGGAGGTNGTGIGGTTYTGSGGAGGLGAGAGLYNLGTAMIVDCTFNQNVAFGGISEAAGGPPQSNGNGLAGANGPNSTGGGICNVGNEIIVNSTFDGNVVVAGNGATGGPGTEKQGNGGNGGNGYGGNVYNAGTNGMTNCTIANGGIFGGTGGAVGTGPFAGTAGANGAGLGANISSTAGIFNLKNSLLAYPSNGVSATGTITDLGDNLSSDATPAFSAGSTNSHNNMDPLLVPLDDNGGVTLTMALLPGSPAIDGIFDASAPATDQRGFLRPFGPRSDIGAFEYGSFTNSFTVQGHVTAGAMAFPGVTIRAGNASTVSDSNGNYSLLLPSGTSYTVAPQPLGYFSPSSSGVMLTTDVANVNFMATNAPATFTNNTTNHTFQMTFSVVPTFSYRIQSATNLISSNQPPTNWVDIATNVATGNAIILTIPSTNFPPQRFFRTVTP